MQPALSWLAVLGLAVTLPGAPVAAQSSSPSLASGLVPLVELPGGSFLMGNTGSAPGEPHEGPPHRVRVAPFAIGTHEVTQAQFEAVMGYNPSLNRGPEHPVERVSWYDAVRFANALSSRDGFEPAYVTDPFEGYVLDPSGDGYRLPTEAEWEYAARGGTTTDTYGGPVHPEGVPQPFLDDIAWYGGGDGPHETRPVGQKLPNAYGLYDVIGNVFEWTDAAFLPYPGGEIDPSTPGAREGARLKVLRGGAMDTGATASRVAYRYRLHPSYTSHNIGFRIARGLR